MSIIKNCDGDRRIVSADEVPRSNITFMLVGGIDDKQLNDASSRADDFEAEVTRVGVDLPSDRNTGAVCDESEIAGACDAMFHQPTERVAVDCLNRRVWFLDAHRVCFSELIMIEFYHIERKCQPQI